MIEAENLKSQATREEDFEKPPTSVTRLPNIWKCKEKVTDQILQSSVKTIGAYYWDQKTNIPVGDLKEKEHQLIHLAEDLKSHIIGQDDAVDKIAKVIRAVIVGLGTPNRPIGSFLVRPTGVGKTELSKTISHRTLCSADSTIRFDMSVTYGKHSVVSWFICSSRL